MVSDSYHAELGSRSGTGASSKDLVDYNSRCGGSGPRQDRGNGERAASDYGGGQQGNRKGCKVHTIERIDRQNSREKD